MYMRVFYGVYGLPTVSLRLLSTSLVRARIPLRNTRAVLAKFITLMLKGERPTIYGRR